MGIIKKLHANELVGFDPNDRTEVYPVVSTECIYSPNGSTLDKYLKDFLDDNKQDPFEFVNSETLSFGVSIYRCLKDLPDTPSNEEGTYDFSTNTLTSCPKGWYTTTLLAEANSVEGSRTIWLSFRNFLIRTIEGTTESTWATSWSTPVKFVNIDGFIEEANNHTELILAEAIADATKDYTSAIDLLRELTTTRINGVEGELTTSIEDLKTYFNGKLVEVKDDYTTYIDGKLVAIDRLVARKIDSFEILYEWKETEESIYGNQISPRVTKALLDAYYRSDEVAETYYGTVLQTIDGKRYKMCTYSASLTTLLALRDKALNAINTTVNEMTPDSIRLLATRGYLGAPVWVTTTKAVWNSAAITNLLYTADSLPTDFYNAETNPSGPKEGDVYRVSVSLLGTSDKYCYYLCTTPMTTSFLKLLADNLKLGIAKTVVKEDGTATTVGGDIYMYFGEDDESVTEITTNRVVIPGDVIAGTVATNGLNVANKAFIDKTGDAWFCMNTPGASMFNADGSGLLSGGKILWDATGKLEIRNSYIDLNTANLSVKAIVGAINASSLKINANNLALNVDNILVRANNILFKDNENKELKIDFSHIENVNITADLVDFSSNKFTINADRIDFNGSSVKIKAGIIYFLLDGTDQVTLADLINKDSSGNWGFANGVTADLHVALGDLHWDKGVLTSLTSA